MAILSSDIGYSHTKDNKGKIFRSAYSTNDTSVLGIKALTINGKNYYPGIGQMTSDVDKTNTEVNMVCLINDIVQNGLHDVCVSTGLPIGQHKAQKDKLAESIMSYNKCTILYDKKPYPIKIHDVLICRQGVSALYTLKDLLGDYIVIDVGGITVDPCLAEFTLNGSQILQADTWYKGMRTLYSSVMSAINNRFETKLDNIYAEKIFTQGLKINRVQQDISFLKPLLQDYIDMIAEEIKLKYPTETTPIYLVGGGTDLLYSSFCKRFQDVHKIVNPQFANANGYYIQGYFKFAQRGVVCG